MERRRTKFHVEHREAALRDLREGAGALGIGVEAHLPAFGKYIDTLARWSGAVRLAGQRDPRKWIEPHLLDSLTPLRVLGEPATLLDVGSGGGFPGVPLAIVRPNWRVTLMESNGRKAAFLRALVADLGLSPRVRVEQARAEGRPVPSYEAVISRAVWPPEEWLARGAPWLVDGGRLVAMLGRDAPSEEALRSLGRARRLELALVFSLRLPFSGAERTLVAWRKR